MPAEEHVVGLDVAVQDARRVRRLQRAEHLQADPGGLADAEGALLEGVTERALFVIDTNGTIAWSYLSPVGVNPGADGILNALEKLRK